MVNLLLRFQTFNCFVGPVQGTVEGFKPFNPLLPPPRPWGRVEIGSSNLNGFNVGTV